MSERACGGAPARRAHRVEQVAQVAGILVSDEDKMESRCRLEMVELVDTARGVSVLDSASAQHALCPEGNEAGRRLDRGHRRTRAHEPAQRLDESAVEFLRAVSVSVERERSNRKRIQRRQTRRRRGERR